MGSNSNGNENPTKYLLRFGEQTVPLKGKTIIDPLLLEEYFEIELFQDKHTNLLSIYPTPFGSGLNIKKECFLIQIGYRFSIDDDWTFLLDSDIINVEIGCFLRIEFYEFVLTLGSVDRDPPKSFLRDYSPIKEYSAQNSRIREEKPALINTQSISSTGLMVENSRSQKIPQKRPSDDVWNYLEDKLEVSLKKIPSKGTSNPETLIDQKEDTVQKSLQSSTINDNELASISVKNQQLDSFPNENTANNYSQKSFVSNKRKSVSNSKQSFMEAVEEKNDEDQLPKKLFSTQSQKSKKNTKGKSKSSSQPKLRSERSLLDDSSDDEGVKVRRFKNFDDFFEVFFGDEESARKNKKTRPPISSKKGPIQRNLVSEYAEEEPENETVNNTKPFRRKKTPGKFVDDYDEEPQVKSFSTRKITQDPQNSEPESELRRFKVRSEKSKSFEDRSRDRSASRNNRSPQAYRESGRQIIENEEGEFVSVYSDLKNRNTKSLVSRLLSSQKTSEPSQTTANNTQPSQILKPLHDGLPEGNDWFEPDRQKKIKLNNRTAFVKEKEAPNEAPPSHRVLRSGRPLNSQKDLEPLSNQTKKTNVSSENQKMRIEKSGVCKICMGEVGEESGRLQECSHVFCYSCIIEWADLTTLCPLCKRPFSAIFKSGIGRKPERIPIKLKNVANSCDWEKYFQHQCNRKTSSAKKV